MRPSAEESAAEEGALEAVAEGAAEESAADAEDRRWRRVLWTLPTGLYVIGSASQGRRNLMTANLVVQVATEPRVVGLSVERSALTHSLIEASEAFAVSILDREDRSIVRKFVKPVEDEPGPGGGALNGFPVHPSSTGSPVLDRAIAYLDCRTVSRLDFESHSFFAGEVVDAGFLGEGEGVEVLRMEDTRMHYGG